MDPFKNIALFKDILNYFNKVVHVKVFYNLWIVLHLNLISGSLSVSISTFFVLNSILTSFCYPKSFILHRRRGNIYPLPQLKLYFRPWILSWLQYFIKCLKSFERNHIRLPDFWFCYRAQWLTFLLVTISILEGLIV